jgi:transposase-like protein
LGHKRYQPIWELVCKLRDVTGKRDDLYKLGGQVELDNAFITTLIPDEQKDEDLKRGAGSQNKSKVTVMTGCTAVENPKPTMPPKRVNHIKMQIVTGLKAYTAAKVVKEQIDSRAELTADDSTTCKKLGQHVKSHRAQVVKPEDLPKILPRVHIATGNVKRLLLDTHRQLEKEHLQYYLNEFCYKFNRRYFGEKLFDRLGMVAVIYPTDFRSKKIYNRTLCG